VRVIFHQVEIIPTHRKIGHSASITVAMREDNEKSSVVGLLAMSGYTATTTSRAVVPDEEQWSRPRRRGGRATVVAWVGSDPDADFIRDGSIGDPGDLIGGSRL
jgi:hypothetical protein